MNGEMLFTLGYLIAGETAAKLFHFGAGVLAAGFVYLAARRLDSPFTGLVAATVFYISPVVAWEANTADIDLFLAMFTAGALVMLLVWLREQRVWQVAIVIGLLLGFGMGVKLSAAYYAIPVGLAILFPAWKNRGKGRRDALLAFLVVTFLTSLAGGIWYLRSFLLTGNPVFPYLNAIFRSPLWYPRNETFNFDTFGFGISLPALLLLPWRITFDSAHFSEMANGAAGLLLLAFAPLVILVPRVIRRLSPVIFVTLFFGLLWALSVQYLRYAIPALLGIAIIAGVAAVGIWRALKHHLPKWAWTVPTFFAVLSCLHLLLIAHQYDVSAIGGIPYDVVLGNISREQYRTNQVWPYKTFGYSNAHLTKNDRIFAVGEWYQYFSDVPLITPFFTVEGDQILAAKSYTALSQALTSAAITHILVDQPQLSGQNLQYLVQSESFLTDHAVLEYSANYVELYRLLGTGEQLPAPGQNMLQNSTFEEVNPQGGEQAWYMFGHPSIDQSGTRAHSGRVAVLVTTRDGFAQGVPVKPDELYTLGHWTRSDRSGQSARLQVNWLDSSGHQFDYTIQFVTTTSQWQWHQMSISAPKGAAFGEVYASVQGDSQVWFDDIKFVAGDR